MDCELVFEQFNAQAIKKPWVNNVYNQEPDYKPVQYYYFRRIVWHRVGSVTMDCTFQQLRCDVGNRQ